MIKCYVVILVVHNTRTTNFKIDHIHDFLLKQSRFFCYFLIFFFTCFYPDNTTNRTTDGLTSWRTQISTAFLTIKTPYYY